MKIRTLVSAALMFASAAFGQVNGNFNNLSAKVTQSVYNADKFCSTPGTYDQSCLASAIATAGNNATIVLAPHTYTFASEVTASNLNNVSIVGSGTGTIIKRDGLAFQCTGCSNLRIANVGFQTVTVPTVVTPASLPSAATALVIDRWGTGQGYIPTINDQDIVTVADGGGCTANCLTHAQANEVFDTGLVIHEGNNIEVSGLTGSFYSVTFYDSSNVNVHGNSVSGGKQFAGIAFWKANSGTAGNHKVVVVDNVVNYAAFSGILLAGTDHAQVTGNVVSYNGESGVKTYQGAPEQSSFVSITGNTSSYNWYDGFDLSSTNPRTSTFAAYSVASGNHSDHNRMTGYITDGLYWTFTGNQASLNGLTGMQTAFCSSTISGNEATGNNTSGAGSGAHQIIASGDVTCGGNTIVGNHTDTAGHAGCGIFASATTSTIIGNTETTGSNCINSANSQFFNTDVNGQQAASQFNASTLFFPHAGATLLTAQSASGFFTVTIPANTGTLAELNLAQTWSAAQDLGSGSKMNGSPLATGTDYYWTATGCATGTGQPVHCSATTTLPGAMPDASYQLFCTADAGSQVEDFECSPHNATLPTASGGTINYNVVQTMQNGGGGGTPTVYFHAHHS